MLRTLDAGLEADYLWSKALVARAFALAIRRSRPALPQTAYEVSKVAHSTSVANAMLEAYARAPEAGLRAIFAWLGLAVEEMETIGEIVDGVVLAKVLDLRPHPDADKIQLVDVDRGDEQPLQVCCGAFNLAVGDLIPFATIGTVMPNGIEIAQRELRGQMSLSLIHI